VHLRILLAVTILISVLAACDATIYRDPCGRVAATTTTMRTKNKALGWVAPSFPGDADANTGRLNHSRGAKCA
jgi:hypothetical protein